MPPPSIALRSFQPPDALATNSNEAGSAWASTSAGHDFARPRKPYSHSSAMLSYTPPSTSTSRSAPANPKSANDRVHGEKAPGTHAEACTAVAKGTAEGTVVPENAYPYSSLFEK